MRVVVVGWDTCASAYLRGQRLEEGGARVVGQAGEGQQHVGELLGVEGGEQGEGVVPTVRCVCDVCMYVLVG